MVWYSVIDSPILSSRVAQSQTSSVAIKRDIVGKAVIVGWFEDVEVGRWARDNFYTCVGGEYSMFEFLDTYRTAEQYSSECCTVIEYSQRATVVYIQPQPNLCFFEW